MKKLIITLLAVVGFSVHAGIVSTNLSAGRILLLSGLTEVLGVTVVNNHTAAATLYLVDANTTTNKYTLPEYQKITASITTATTYYTNVWGGTNVIVTNAVVTYTTNTISAAAYDYPVKLVVPVAAGSMVTLDFSDTPIEFIRGVQVTNNVAGNSMTLHLNYRK